MTLALIILTALFITLALFRLDWAVLTIIAALPAYLIRFNILGLPLTFLEVMILIVFSIWFLKYFAPNIKNLFRNKDARVNYPYSLEIILVLIISLIAVGTAGWSASALGIWKAYFFEPLLLFILLFNIFKTKQDWLKIFWALAISVAAVSLFAIFQQATGLFISNPFWAAEATRRVVSFFGYPNAVGLYLAPLIIIMSGWLASLNWQDGILFHDKIKKIFLILTIIVSLFAVYFAKSEGALVGLVAGFFIFCLFAGKKSRLAALGLAIVFSAGIYFYTPARNLIIQKATLSDLSGSIRKQQWKETLKMLNDSRLISGAGLSGYQTAVAPYHQEGLFYNNDNLPDFDAQLRASAEMRAKYWQPVEIYLYPHNIFLNFWSELGLIGALLFAWIIIKYLIISIKLGGELTQTKNTDKYLAYGLTTAMIAIVVHGLVDVPYFKNDLSVMFWIIIALGAALNLNYRTNKK
jgi:O-antigen ligase